MSIKSDFYDALVTIQQCCEKVTSCNECPATRYCDKYLKYTPELWKLDEDDVDNNDDDDDGESLHDEEEREYYNNVLAPQINELNRR